MKKTLILLALCLSLCASLAQAGLAQSPSGEALPIPWSIAPTPFGPQQVVMGCLVYHPGVICDYYERRPAQDPVAKWLRGVGGAGTGTPEEIPVARTFGVGIDGGGGGPVASITAGGQAGRTIGIDAHLAEWVEESYMENGKLILVKRGISTPSLTTCAGTDCFGEQAWKEIYTAKDGQIVLERIIRGKIIPAQAERVEWPE